MDGDWTKIDMSLADHSEFERKGPTMLSDDELKKLTVDEFIETLSRVGIPATNGYMAYYWSFNIDHPEISRFIIYNGRLRAVYGRWSRESLDVEEIPSKEFQELFVNNIPTMLESWKELSQVYQNRPDNFIPAVEQARNYMKSVKPVEKSELSEIM